MGYLQSSLIHPPYGEQKLGTLVALFRPSVPYHLYIGLTKHIPVPDPCLPTSKRTLVKPAHVFYTILFLIF